MTHYYYLTETDEVVRIRANKKPGPTGLYPGLWVVQELFDAAECADKKPTWHATWEITWGRLSKLTYIGKVKV